MKADSTPIIDRLFLMWVLCLCSLFVLSWTYTYDTDTPAGSDDPAEADDRMREIKAAIQERMAVEHNWALTGTEVSGATVGTHSAITCDSLTSTGAISGTTITGSGNLSITGTGTITGVATLGDSSQMATSAAPTANADLANKKYVDDRTKGAITTLNDSNSDAMLKSQAYLAQTPGFVMGRVDTTSLIQGYLGSTTDPAGAGQFMGRNRESTSGGGSTGFFVPDGMYFEFTCNDAITIIWTPLVSGGGAPVDQD